MNVNFKVPRNRDVGVEGGSLLALSIRQPWAWLIVNAGKDVENRTWPTKFRGPVLIHAAKTMTKSDYEACALFCATLPEGTFSEDFWFPTMDDLRSQCGGIVGRMRIADCVESDSSPWFCGPFGFKIADVTAEPFQPCKGALGFFNPTICQ